MSFARAYFSSCLGALTAMIAFSVIGFFLFVGMLGNLQSEEKVVVNDNSVLHLRLDAQFSELQPDLPFEGIPGFGPTVPRIGLLQLKESIANAKDDGKIKGIFIDVSYPMTGFATLAEIRQSLLDFRESGKWVIAYSEVMSEGAYYVASAADGVYINPEGEIEFNGLVANVTFFKKLLDKLEIRPQVFRVGEFKSAVEPFLLEEMSDENRLQLSGMVNSIYDHMLSGISESRNIPVDKLRAMADNMEVRSASSALDAGLIDGLFYKDQMDKHLRERLNIGEEDDIQLIKYHRYRKSFSTYKRTGNEVAVIVAEGAIMPGTNDGAEGVIAAESFVQEIRRARLDDDVKAIVLRVNSPGGEFRASDMIWRELELAKAEKPVIASMSDYAASGGYYLSMGCDTIVAQPHTITGSIGIFGIIFDLSNFLENKLGVTFDEVRTGKYGDTYTVSRPLTTAERSMIQKMLEENYDTFTSKAAEGRDVSVEAIKAIASGRVWTGAQAQERQLVDILGGIDDAINIAASKAGVADDYRVRYYPQPKPFIEELLNQFDGVTAQRVDAELGDLRMWYQRFKEIESYHGSQARMPFVMEIQ